MRAAGPGEGHQPDPALAVDRADVSAGTTSAQAPGCTVQVRGARPGRASSPSAFDGERVAADGHLPAAGTSARRRGRRARRSRIATPKPQPGQRAGRRRDHDVQQPVVGLGVRGDLRAATDRAPVGRRRPSAPASPSWTTGSPSTSTRSAHPVVADPGQRAAHGVRGLAQPLLQRARLLGRLGPDPEVHGVDDHPAGVVDDQVQGARPAGQQRPGGLRRVERDAQARARSLPVPRAAAARSGTSAESSPRRAQRGHQRCAPTRRRPPATTCRPSRPSTRRGQVAGVGACLDADVGARRAARPGPRRRARRRRVPADAFVTTSSRFT